MKLTVKALAVAGAAVSCTAFLAAPAQAAATAAGTARVVDGDAVHLTAIRGAVNDLVVTRSGKVVTLDDRVAIKAGPGCVAVQGDRTKVRCTATTEARFVILDLSDRDDRFVNRAGMYVDVRGGAGNDRLIGGAGYDNLAGGPGNDIVSGGGDGDSLNGDAGDDTLDGGTGNDILNTDAGRDVLRGGTGRDLVYYGSRTAPVHVDPDGAKGDDGARGEGDSVGADVEDLIGGRAADRLIGNAAGNRIHGGHGNDYIAGGNGHDILVGQNGNDTLRGDAGDDHLIGEQDPRASDPEGSLSDNPRARDHLNGGLQARRGDICRSGKHSTKVSCEIRG